MWLMTADPSLIGLRGNIFSRMSVEKQTDLPMPLSNVVAISYDTFVFISPYKGFINYIVYFCFLVTLVNTNVHIFASLTPCKH